MSGFLVTGIAHGLTGARDGARLVGALRVADGRIAEIGALEPKPGERVVDASGCVVIPGLVNTHHHLFQSMLKAVPAGMNLPLEPWLAAVPYMFWPRLDEEKLRISARIGLAELALSGATTICDHHYIFSERYDYDPAEILFEEAARLGFRLVLARGGATRGRVFDDPDIPPPPVETLDAFLSTIAATADRWHDPSDDAMTRVAVAPTTPTFNVDAGELREIAAFARARGLRLHSHLSENEGYAAYTEGRHGKRPVHWLAEHDWLGPDVWFAHLVDLEASEVVLLADTGTAMAHCPQANARLGSGIAPAAALHDLGGTVSLAVDGAAANEAADMGAALLFRPHDAAGGPWRGRGHARRRSCTGRPPAAPRPSACRRSASLAPGMAADLAILDLSAPRNLGLHDPALAPVVTGGIAVRHSFVAGRPVVVDGRLPGLDLAELASDAHRVTAALAGPDLTPRSRSRQRPERARVVAP